MAVRFTGTDRNGTARTGVLPLGADVAEWTEIKFSAGWQALTVTRDGEKIAAIEDTVDGNRMWWAAG